MDINEIRFSYDKKTFHLNGIKSRIAEGRITTIIGPNGCGKSTLLGVMAKNLRPSEGEVLLNGKKLAQFKPKELGKKLAVVHQQQEAPADLTVEKLVRFGRLPHRGRWGQESELDDEAVDWALSCTNLLSKRKQSLAHLSGGERQRAWIAMALAQQTSLLFLDEPTTYLDIYHQIEILELVKTLNRKHGITIVMVLHDMNQAIRYSDHIIVMKLGCIVGEGAPETVVTAETIKQTYGVDVVMKNDGGTGLYMVPLGI